MRAKGYTPAIRHVCQRLDANLQTMYDDLSLYLDSATNHSDVTVHLQQTSRDSIAQLIETIKSTEPSTPAEPTLIALATLFAAIAELCPNLRLCLFQNVGGGGGIGQRSEQWDIVYRLLDEESNRFWSQWITVFQQQSLFSTPGPNPFAAQPSFVELAKELLAWQTITIEEKDESDRPIESVIRVPQAPALSLQRCLSTACTRLNDIVPYVLPRSVARSFSAQLIDQLLAIYRTYAECEFVRTNQTASLQAYFDVKFIQLTLVLRTDKRASDALQTLAHSFKSNVDPFDFELFHKYLVVNVKRAAQRMLHKLGAIIPNAEQITMAAAGGGGGNAASSGSGGGDKEPNVLALSTAAAMDGWFSMLPVMSSTSTSAATFSAVKQSDLVSARIFVLLSIIIYNLYKLLIMITMMQRRVVGSMYVCKHNIV